MTPAQDWAGYLKLLAQTDSWGPARQPDRPEVDKVEERNEETAHFQTPRPALSPRQAAASSRSFPSHSARAGLGLPVSLLANKLSAHQKMPTEKSKKGQRSSPSQHMPFPPPKQPDRDPRSPAKKRGDTPVTEGCTSSQAQAPDVSRSGS